MSDPDLLATYLERLAHRDFSEHTLRAYRSDLRGAAAALGKPLVEATAEELEAYLADLARQGLKATTLRRKQSSLRGFYAHARRDAVPLADQDPTRRFEPPKLEQRLPVFLADDQVEKLFAQLGADDAIAAREAAVIAILYFTGARADEIRKLNWEDITPEGIRVFGKGRRERMLPVDPRLSAYLGRWLAYHPTRRGAVFVQLRSPFERLSYWSLSKIFKGAVARAGLAGRRFTCHKMRHTFATRAVRSIAIDKVQKLLGHRRIDTTTLYAHTELGHDVGAALGGAL